MPLKHTSQFAICLALAGLGSCSRAIHPATEANANPAETPGAASPAAQAVMPAAIPSDPEPAFSPSKRASRYRCGCSKL